MDDKKIKRSAAAGSAEEIVEKRREQRFDVPDVYREYIRLRVLNGDKFVPAVLGNFSRSGVLFACSVPFGQGDHTECIISVSLLLAREISFGIEVKYCYADHGSFVMGASIDSISDETWFDVFVEVHDYIMLRQGAT